ncbi:MAG: hypothetical protein WAN71_07555, partial [Mycobacterium sp.]|uniref:hypothetical protein n=1 Tax=Mycobacterium sp. TaxID=1785 RepID=UPI003BB09BCB
QSHDQCILGELAVLVIFVCGAEPLDDACDPVGVSIAATGQPNACRNIRGCDFRIFTMVLS